VNPDQVPTGPLVVDTDVASWIRTGHENAKAFAPLLRGHVLCLSFATVGELWAGAEIAGWGEKRRAALDSFIRTHVVLPVDNAVTMHWARIHAAFRDQVGVNDEWIAACALAQSPQLPVVTGNLRHFDPIAARFGLTIVHPDTEPAPGQ
jgi:predicted nucleic acid-binding protein